MKVTGEVRTEVRTRIGSWKRLQSLLAVVLSVAAFSLSAAVVPAGAPDTNAPPTNETLWDARLTQIEEQLTSIAGPWISDVVFYRVTWLQILLAIAVALVAVLVWQILRSVLRRWIRKDAAAPRAESPATAPPGTEPTEERPRWLRLTLEAALPPLTVLVWVLGIYAAGSILIARVTVAEGHTFLSQVLAWCLDVGQIVVLFWFLYRMIAVAELQLKRWSAKTKKQWDDILATVFIRAIRLVVPLVGVMVILPTLSIPASAEHFFRVASSLALIAAIGFIVYELAKALEAAVIRQYRRDVADNLAARKITTQVQVLRKLAVVLIVVFTAGSMLMVFDSVRQLGASILASAGVLGIILGFAAQRSIATIVAGFQIAMTQPIRLDDVVIVEGEWGTVEEITLTYVVVKIWDLRRLIVPINYFIERPFQNWTRTSADILGSVLLFVDYTTPIAELRPVVEDIVKKARDWDGKFWNLQVTDATERTIQIRVLVTAGNSGSAWNLRCEIREKLLDYLQTKYPSSLPRVRAELPFQLRTDRQSNEHGDEQLTTRRTNQHD